jgi:hypothetical protein
LSSIGHAVVRVEPLQVVLAQEAERAHAEEAEPRDMEVRGDTYGPGVAEVGHDARRVRRVRAEVALERGREKLQRAEVVRVEFRRYLVDVVGSVWQAHGRAVERELHEPDRQAGLPGEVDRREDARRIVRRCHDAGERAVGGQQQRGVHRRDHVPLVHQRDKHEVRLSSAADVIVCRFCVEAIEAGRVTASLSLLTTDVIYGASGFSLSDRCAYTKQHSMSCINYRFASDTIKHLSMYGDSASWW